MSMIENNILTRNTELDDRRTRLVSITENTVLHNIMPGRLPVGQLV